MSSLVEQKFGEAAADYATSAVHARGPSLARVVELVAPQAAWRALDVATGAGHTALTFAPHVGHVIASDITEEMLAQARALAEAKALGNVETARADAAALPFEMRDLRSRHVPACRASLPRSGGVRRRGLARLEAGRHVGAHRQHQPRRRDDASASGLSCATQRSSTTRSRSCAIRATAAAWRWRSGSSCWATPGSSICAPKSSTRTSPLTPGLSACAAMPVPSAGSRSMLGGEQLTALLKPRVTNDGLIFSLRKRSSSRARPTRMSKAPNWQNASAPTLADFEVLAAAAWERCRRCSATRRATS